MGELVVKQA